MSRQTRRSFLKKTAAASLGASFVIAGTKASGRVIGANDKVRIGCAGINGRGQSHIGGYCGSKNTEVTYLIDVDRRLWDRNQKAIKSRTGNTPKCVADVREALDDKNLDAISIATPNHWHALMSIWGCQAGKHVYVEKPCCHNVFEGRKLAEAAEKYGVVVQHGTQQRSDQRRADEMAALHSGKYGEVLVAKGYCCKPRWSIGYKPNTQPPKELDFNLWLGPAPEQPYHENLVHYNWHWFWDFGNGEIGNQGVHEMDVARWAVTAATGRTLPKSVISLGGRFGYKDQGQTPNTQLTIFDFGEAKLFFEDYGLARGKNQHCTNSFFVEEGVIHGGQFHPNGGGPAEGLPDVDTCYPGGPFGNFINCVRSRKREELNAEVLEGHLSSALSHLGNTSYRLGEEVPFNEDPAVLADDKDSVEAFENMKDHLARRGNMNLEESQYRLGRKLNFDPSTEKFIDDSEADQLLTRPYRAPFVVPEEV